MLIYFDQFNLWNDEMVDPNKQMHVFLFFFVFPPQDRFGMSWPRLWTRMHRLDLAQRLLDWRLGQLVNSPWLFVGRMFLATSGPSFGIFPSLMTSGMFSFIPSLGFPWHIPKAPCHIAGIIPWDPQISQDISLQCRIPWGFAMGFAMHTLELLKRHVLKC